MLLNVLPHLSMADVLTVSLMPIQQQLLLSIKTTLLT
jgi:hypothetical protein